MGHINRACTFNNFIVGPSNRNAYAFCMEAFEHAAGRLNPLFLHGETGTGKTHLLKSILARSSVADKRTIHIKGRIACREGLLPAVAPETNLAELYPRFLLIDDLDELAASDENVEDLVYLLDSVSRCGPQIVVSSTLPPGCLYRIGTQSLMRRLVEGVVVKLFSLDVETRRSILTNELTRLEIPLSSGGISFLSDLPLRNFSQLRGVIMKLVVESEENKRLDEKFVFEMLTRMIEAREIDLPEEFCFQELPTSGKSSSASTHESDQGEAVFEVKPMPDRAGEPAANDLTANDLDELEKKFDDISRKITEESGDQANTVDSASDAMSKETGLIEEWEQDEDRLIEED